MTLALTKTTIVAPIYSVRCNRLFMASFRALPSQFCEASQSNNLKHDDVRMPAFACGRRNLASFQKANAQEVRRPLLTGPSSDRHALRLRGSHPRARPGVAITTMVRQVKAQSLSCRRSLWADSGRSAPAAERGVFAPKWNFRDYRRVDRPDFSVSYFLADLFRIWAHRGRPWRDRSRRRRDSRCEFSTIRLHGGLRTSSCRPKRKSLIGTPGLGPAHSRRAAMLVPILTLLKRRATDPKV